MRRTSVLILFAVLLSLVSASCAAQAVPTATATPSSTPIRTPTLTSTPEVIEITVYFTDSERYAQGKPPYEVAVSRFVDAPSGEPEAVMRMFFQGPTGEERDRGLERVDNGFTGYRWLTIEDGVARIHLRGECRSSGGTYTIAQPIRKNLLQFPDVEYVKIYDEHGNTGLPEGRSDSIPACLEP